MMSVIVNYFRQLIQHNKELILREILEIKGLMQMLMKRRNTGEKWTREERKQIKLHLRNISKIVPVVAIFLLPGGALLLPFLAKILDRRRVKRF